jgi:hypothetical protein
VLSEKKILNEKKTIALPPPLQVKWSVPKTTFVNEMLR